MGVNLDKPHLWKLDIAQSVDMYNEWFLKFAPATFRATRVKATEFVREALERTKYLADIGPEVLGEYPQVLPTLRMSCCPPIAVDRLIGLGKSSRLISQGDGKRQRASA